MIGMDDQAFAANPEVLHGWWDADAEESCDLLVGIGAANPPDKWNLFKVSEAHSLEDVPLERLRTPSASSAAS